MIIKNLGITDYLNTFEKMQQFTKARDPYTQDEIWITEHHPVFTHGINSSNKNILNPCNIAIVKTDRGGQVTYHGLGQIVVYIMFDLKKLQVGVKKTVNLLEQAVINLLETYNIKAHRIARQAGVYIAGAKISALGLKIRNGKTYHGISLNTEMDLTPFKNINPCGYQDLKVCQMSDFTQNLNLQKIGQELANNIIQVFTILEKTTK